ncbi:expressed unknown protein [Seminavis robusta]|uniref:Helicase-associated domain-containing protein n=1 Tax=Seminavis robusta TaxID=568900 RepID=A0A9N8HLL7_9STRA|nr:expressed unknown protein [Seminavis robusta]|eukprot:Sro819_g207050.1 n/a (401) ;mRNA; r:11909-13111
MPLLVVQRSEAEQLKRPDQSLARILSPETANDAAIDLTSPQPDHSQSQPGVPPQLTPTEDMLRRKQAKDEQYIRTADAVEAAYLAKRPRRDGTQECKWWRRYARLKVYRQVYGDAHVPSRFPMDRQLGLWVRRQRESYQQGLRGETGAYDEHRAAALESIGFVWRLKDKPTMQETKQRGVESRKRTYLKNLPELKKKPQPGAKNKRKHRATVEGDPEVARKKRKVVPAKQDMKKRKPAAGKQDTKKGLEEVAEKKVFPNSTSPSLHQEKATDGVVETIRGQGTLFGTKQLWQGTIVTNDGGEDSAGSSLRPGFAYISPSASSVSGSSITSGDDDDSEDTGETDEDERSFVEGQFDDWSEEEADTRSPLPHERAAAEEDPNDDSKMLSLAQVVAMFRELVE